MKSRIDNATQDMLLGGYLASAVAGSFSSSVTLGILLQTMAIKKFPYLYPNIDPRQIKSVDLIDILASTVVSFGLSATIGGIAGFVHGFIKDTTPSPSISDLPSLSIPEKRKEEKQKNEPDWLERGVSKAARSLCSLFKPSDALEDVSKQIEHRMNYDLNQLR